MSRPAYTIENALPRLYSLSLPSETLFSRYFLPPEGLEFFLQYRLRVFVHTLMRAITHDFVHMNALPIFPISEHRKLRTWIAVLMKHFQLIARTLRYRADQVSGGDLPWARQTFNIPAEASQMFKLAIFLCNFVAFTTSSRLPAELDYPILHPLIEISARQLLLTGTRGDYAEYDEKGRYDPACQLFAQSEPFYASPGGVILSPMPLHTTPLAMGFTDSFAHFEVGRPELLPENSTDTVFASNYARKRLLLNFFSLATHSSNPPTQPNAVPSRLLQRPSNPSQLQPQVREEIQGALLPSILQPRQTPRLRALLDFASRGRISRPVSWRSVSRKGRSWGKYRLHYHLADPPLPDWKAINRRLEFAVEHVRGATYRLEAVESNAVDPSELRPRPVRPDVPPPLADLPPLPELPFLDANAKPPHPLDDDLTAAQEAENFAFFEGQAARYRERKQIRDDHSAECARLQLAHETAYWRAYEEDLEVWQAENVGLQHEIAEYQEELEFTRATLRECEEEYEKACTRAGRYIIRHHEIKALTRHIIQLRDQVAYAHELKVALQGNVSLGPAIDVFLEASHLGEVPPGFSYRPVAEEPARPDVLSSLVSRETSPPLVSPSKSRKGKEVDPRERPGSRPQATVPSPSPLGRKIFITVPALPSDSRPFAAPRGESSKKRTAADEGAGRPAKKAKPSKPFSQPI
ncbi:hypothetical protein C8F04DRAFT_1408228 [Mycena alexandri]|uniref:Uncharacterized protein n=1 Tax=Mycena alexandri TaxID=1745969 RepID=A0AAD6RVG3_9AGAR|nr:hypothetical protein C8F04DRAFT_1408228 [Mycena alexandri]